MNIMVYKGPNCSLCNLALDIVEQFNSEFADTLAKIEVQQVNIRDSAELYHLYGAKIPVLKKIDAEGELCWPFTLENLVEFLK
jgi:hypothetical protein